jgi:hypothetical protein
MVGTAAGARDVEDERMEEVLVDVGTEGERGVLLDDCAGLLFGPVLDEVGINIEVELGTAEERELAVRVLEIAEIRDSMEELGGRDELGPVVGGPDVAEVLV